MANEPVVSNQNALSTASAEDLWGQSQVSAKDVVLPKIRILQGQSQAVLDGDAKFGQIIENLGGEVLGDFEKPVHLIPFHMEKLWVKYDCSGPKRQFKGIEPMVDENLEWRYTENGVPMERDYTFQFYALPVEGSADAIPHVVQFSRTSSRAGKVLATLMYLTNRNAGLLPPAFTVNLKAVKKANDDGTWGAFDIAKDRKSTDKEIESAKRWMMLIHQGKTKVDHSDLEGDDTVAYTEGKEPQF